MLHKQDQKWFREQLAKIPAAYIQQAKDGYQSVWENAYNYESIEHKKQNSARRAANIRLREFVKKINNRLT